MIVEFVSSGEKVTNRKYLIDLRKRVNNCYAFVKNVKGKWYLYKTTDMDKETSHYMMNFPIGDENQVWQDDVKELLLLSLFNKSDVKIKPVTCLPEKEFKKFMACLP